MNALITEAIVSRKLIEMIYDGNRRIVEPHCFGSNSKGHEILRAFQVEGYSSTGKMGWKLYNIAKISSLVLLDKIFLNPRPGYVKGDRGMNIIYCEL